MNQHDSSYIKRGTFFSFGKTLLIISMVWLSLHVSLLSAQRISQEEFQRIIWEYPLQKNLVLDESFREILQEEMQKIRESGDLFFRPLSTRFSDQIFDDYALYTEPGRILRTLAMALPYLAESEQQALKGMVPQLLASEIHAPWAPSPLPRDQGKHRSLFEPAETWGIDSDFGLYRPGIQAVYDLWLYFYRSADTLGMAPWYSTIRQFYNQKVVQGIDPGNLYGTMGAHIGMARLAHAFSDPGQLDIASNHLMHFLEMGLDIHWVDSMAFYGLQGWNAPYAQEYSTRKDHWLYRGFPFLHLGPEIGRYLHEHLLDSVYARHHWGLNRFPLWWLRQSPYFNRWTGDEGVGIPSESFGMFMPVERWVMQAAAEQMAQYMLSAPDGLGDSYWIEALVMTLEAGGQDEWVDVRLHPFTTDIITNQTNYAVEFRVNMSYATAPFGSHLFDPLHDTVYISGSMLDWAEPGSYPAGQAMSRIGNSMIWNIHHELEAGIHTYLYYINAGWDGAEWTENEARNLEVGNDMIQADWFGSPDDPSSLPDDHSLPLIQVFPNPASDWLTVEFSSEWQEFWLYDMHGQLLKRGPLQTQIKKLNLQDLYAGAYLFIAKDYKDQLFRKIIIVAR